MLRLFSVIGAAICLLVGIAFALDVVNFETDRADRWSMILAFGGVAFFIGILSATGSDRSSETTSGRPTTRRAAAPEATKADLPSAPGTLHRRLAVADELPEPRPFTDTEVAPIPAMSAGDDVVADVETTAVAEVETVDVAAEVESIEDEVAPVEAEVVAVAETVDAPDAAAVLGDDVGPSDETVDEDLPTLERIDLTEERAAVTLSGERPAEPVAPAPEPITEEQLAAAAEELVLRGELRLENYDDADLQRVVQESEAAVIAEMVRTGQLSSEGPLTDHDVASMVFIAYTSSEMLADLRARKSSAQGVPLS